MLMTKGLDSKILYSILIVSGFVLTIGAASAVVMYSENIELDNGAGDSSIKITTSTGDSKLIVEDKGGHSYSVSTRNGQGMLQIRDETLSKTRISLEKSGQVGIGVLFPAARLDVNGNIHSSRDVIVDRDLKVGGVITGSYIAALEATIADLEARIVSLEASLVINEPMILTNEGMIATHDITLASHDAMILTNQADIAVNAEAIAEGGGGPNPCNPNGDSEITAQEIKDLLDSMGINYNF